MNPRSGILCAGNWIVDRVKMIDTYPHEEALANILSESTANGGGAFNVAVDLARLGVEFPILANGCVGEDVDGDWISMTCGKNGIDTQHLKKVSASHTSYTDVMTVRGTGRRTFFHHRGANALFEPTDIPIETSEAKILHLAYLLLLDRFDEACPEFGTAAARQLALAKKAGFTVSIDVVSEEGTRFASVVAPALPYVDVCFMNEYEAARTTGFTIDGPADLMGLRNAARALLKQGVKQIVALHSEAGGFGLTRKGHEVWQPAVAIPQTKVAGAVGAGDAFAAGFLLGHHNGEPLESCLLYAVSTAASSLKHASASDGVESLEKCLELSSKFGFQDF